MSNALVLKCSVCDWRLDTDLTMGVVEAHFEAEHAEQQITLELVAICDRCDRQMEFFATSPKGDGFQCKQCHRWLIVPRAAREAK